MKHVILLVMLVPAVAWAQSINEGQPPPMPSDLPAQVLEDGRLGYVASAAVACHIRSDAWSTKLTDYAFEAAYYLTSAKFEGRTPISVYNDLTGFLTDNFTAGLNIPINNCEHIETDGALASADTAETYGISAGTGQ